MKVTRSLVLALLVSSLSIAQMSFAEEMNTDSVDSTQADTISAAASDLGSDSLVESPIIRDHRGGSAPIVRGPSRPVVSRPGPIVGRPGGVVVRPAPRPPVVVGRPGYNPGRPGYYPGQPGRVIVRGPRPPVIIRGGIYGWPAYRHRTIVTRVYPFAWNRLQSVTCSSINNYGEEFSVTESGYVGDAYYPIMVNVENAAVDRCYNETGGDPSCRVLTCTPNYYSVY